MPGAPRDIILVGAGFDENTTTWGRDKIMGDLLRMAPSAKLIHQTAGLRPLSRDGLS